MVTFEPRITLKYDFIQSTKILSAIQQHTGTTVGNGVRETSKEDHNRILLFYKKRDAILTLSSSTAEAWDCLTFTSCAYQHACSLPYYIIICKRL
ncbi:hypothetical protein EB796_013656 [Bugula neritina]|uniref:Uncharacterized protein n=1 Tax=Bugula neritina TaxID=10212 RepID=A0A7J7JNU1_BUGNE|nr:hypothetical protein EB796_013656 [Bugula neritina]